MSNSIKKSTLLSAFFIIQNWTKQSFCKSASPVKGHPQVPTFSGTSGEPPPQRASRESLGELYKIPVLSATRKFDKTHKKPCRNVLSNSTKRGFCTPQGLVIRTSGAVKRRYLGIKSRSVNCLCRLRSPTSFLLIMMNFSTAVPASSGTRAFPLGGTGRG